MVSLPDRPAGKELEELVAAVYQVAGYYVEKSVVETEPSQQVLELDAVATNYGATGPAQRLIEVKSGAKWGFPDLFKLGGQMHYLGVGSGAFYASELAEGRNEEFLRERCARIGIQFCRIDPSSQPNGLPTISHPDAPVVDDIHGMSLWRFSYWVERILFERLSHGAKSNPQHQALRDAVRYFNVINNETFFENDVRARSQALYSAFQDHPRLTSAMCRELSGGIYDPQSTAAGGALLDEAMYEGKHEWVQASMYLEHRARLGILKAVVDYATLKATGQISPRDHVLLKAFPVVSWFDFLPSTFRTTLAKLGEHEHFQKYPYFWQVFLWTWGGFFLTHRRDEEFAELSRQTGVPVESIPDALTAFDTLFPVPGGSWFASPSSSDITLLKMMPVAFRGIGAFQRLLRGGTESYATLGGSGYTGQDLVRWHNVGHAFLTGSTT